MYIDYKNSLAHRNRIFNSLVLFIIICFLAINNIVWLAKDTRPPSWDQSTHLGLSIKYLKIISNPPGDIFKQLLGVSSYYPPFYHLSLVLSHFVFGIYNNSAAMINIIYLALIVIFTFKIGAHFFDDKVGLLAAFIVSMYQFLIYISRSCLIDVALVSMVTMGIYFLLKTKDFGNRKFSIIFGIIFGIGMLTKWTFLLFIFIPLALAIIRIIKRLTKPIIFLLYFTVFILSIILVLFLIAPYKFLAFLLMVFMGWRILNMGRENETYINIRNISLSGLLAFIIAGPWYLYNFVSLLIHFTTNVGEIAVAEGDPLIFNARSFLYYFWGLSEQLQLVFFMLFLIGIVLFFVKWDKKNSPLIQWFSIPYLIFIFIRNKDLRFTVPYLPAVSIISVCWLPLLRKIVLRRLIVWVIIIIGIGQFFLFSYNMSNFSQELTLNTPIHKFSIYSSYPPKRENWRHKEIFKVITDDIKSYKKSNVPFALVRVLSNYPYFHGESFEFYTMSNNMQIYPIGYRTNLGEFTDYLIFKTGDRGPGFSIKHYEEAIREVKNPESSFNKTFSILTEVLLPDETKGVVYKLDVEPFEKIELEEVKSKLKESLKTFIQESEELTIDIIPFSKKDTSCGKFKKIIVKASRCRIKDIYIEKLNLEFEDIWLNLYKLMGEKKIILFRLRRIAPHIVINKEDIQNFIIKKINNLNIRNLKLLFEEQKIHIKGDVTVKNMIFPLNVVGEVHLNGDSSAIYTMVNKIELGPFEIPHFLYIRLFDRKFSLYPTPDWALETDIKDIRMTDDSLIIE